MKIIYLAILLVAAAVPVAAAQESEGADLEAEARARFDLAEVHMRNGRFAEAAAEFEQAHELSGRYELLFNVHLAYRDAGEPGRAADALEAFLAEAPADLENRVNLEARVATLRAQAERQDTSSESTEASPPAPVAPPEEDAADADNGGPGVLPWVLVGVGGAALVGAAITGGVALGISNDLSSSCPDRSCAPDRQGDADTGKALAITADVLLGVGIAAAAVGVVLLVIGSGDDEDSVALGGACTGEGCMMSARGSF